ncbi:histidine kinase, partial [Streptomyces sp. SID2955]|nr:histidine kinase [Streptomyces sp. SID2955]
MVRLPGRSTPRPPRSSGHPRAPHNPPRPERGRGRRPGRLRSAVSGRSVAGQVFVLQVVIVLLLVVSAVVAQVLQVRHDSDVEAANRSLAVAETFANAPGTAAALRSPDPTALLQPSAEAARKATGVDFIVVMSTDGVRYTHPQTDRIGKKFVGDIGPALAG